MQLPMAAAIAAAVLAFPALAQTRLTVMSFNVWGAGLNDGQPIDATVAAIKAVDPDVIGVQEVRAEADPCTAEACPPAGPSIAAELAAALGFHLYEQTEENPALWAGAVLSRYPIAAALGHGLGVTIRVDGRDVHVFNVHFPDAPYQPYQLVGISYGPHPFIASEAEAIAQARLARGPGVRLLLDEVAKLPAAVPVLITGDFNEPSHRDWTARAAAAGRHPIAVRYPTTSAIEAAGFVDAFRAVHPDELAKPGFTWTPTTAPDDPEDHHDRIDFVFARGAGLTIEDAAIVGEDGPYSDRVVVPWPSDHRAVLATVSF